MQAVCLLIVLAVLLTLAVAASIPSTIRERSISSTIRGLSLTCTLTIASRAIAASSDEVRDIGSVEEAADFIRRNCGNILAASRSCGRLLYRGDTSYSNKLALRDPTPDLLEDGTYFGQAGAVDYFRALDEKLFARGYSTVRRGHIATGSPNEAGKWGPIHVIFPLDGDFITLKSDLTFWKNNYNQLQNKGTRGPLFWRNEDALTSYLSDELRINSGLEAALSREAEVLFAPQNNDCSFVGIPMVSLTKICTLLGIVPYSQKVIFKKTLKNMEIEGDVRKLSNPTRFVFY